MEILDVLETGSVEEKRKALRTMRSMDTRELKPFLPTVANIMEDLSGDLIVRLYALHVLRAASTVLWSLSIQRADTPGTSYTEYTDKALGEYLFKVPLIKDEETIELLFSVIEDKNEDLELRVIACSVLRAGMQEKLDSRDDLLLRGMQSKQENVRNLFTCELGARISRLKKQGKDYHKWGDAAANWLAKEKSPRVKFNLARALGEAGDERGTEALVRLLDCLENDISFSAATYLMEKGIETGRSFLKKALGSKEQGARLSAAEKLLSAGDESAKGVLRQVLRSKDPFLRLRAAGSLVSAGDESGIPVLEKGLSHRDWKVRGCAAEYISWTRRRSLAKALQRALGREKNDQVRVDIKRALRYLETT